MKSVVTGLMEMVSSESLVVVLIISMIAFIIIMGVVYWLLRPVSESTTENIDTDEYSPFSYWGQSVQSSDASRNTCKLYQFSGSLLSQEVCGVKKAIPAQPVYDFNTVNSLQPQSLPSCYDVDQLPAVQALRTCEALDVENDGVNGSGQTGVSLCTSSDGRPRSVGSTEELYTNTAVSSTGSKSVSCDVKPCSGTLSLYGLNYKVITVSRSSIEPIAPVCPGNNSYGLGMRCLKSIGEGSFSTSSCDLTDQNQLFRVTRSESASTSIKTTGSGGTSGPLGQIFSRVDGACIVQDLEGNKSAITTGRCGTGWLFQKQLFTGSVGSVQQTVYVGGLSQDEITRIISSDNDSDRLQLILASDLYSLQLDGDGNPVMAPFSTYNFGSYTDDDAMAASQIVDYTLYNNILFKSVPLPF